MQDFMKKNVACYEPFSWFGVTPTCSSCGELITSSSGGNKKDASARVLGPMTKHCGLNTPATMGVQELALLYKAHQETIRPLQNRLMENVKGDVLSTAQTRAAGEQAAQCVQLVQNPFGQVADFSFGDDEGNTSKAAMAKRMANRYKRDGERRPVVASDNPAKTSWADGFTEDHVNTSLQNYSCLHLL
eukprot:g73763.t1